MKRTVAIMAGAALVLLFATVMLVVMPYIQLDSEPVPSSLKPYTAQELRGRHVYIANGCIYCHSQQPRDPAFSDADQARGWGRAAVPGDYAYDNPHLMGTMRTGPDLFNIGARQPSVQWHLLHLYAPRAVVADSIMPSHRFLFETMSDPPDSATVLDVPAEFAPVSGKVVATQQALDLVAYLLALDHTYAAEVLPEGTDNEGAGE